ncbi:MAG: AAA family ATPase [Flavobacteriales bacterium]|nr:MAG: AAA family ATPase [Flavobacteriales bacterium]
MLLHPIIEKLKQLRLNTIANAIKDQAMQAGIKDLSFEERLGLLVDLEMTARESKRLQSRLKNAKFKEDACFEDIDYHTPRGLDKSVLASLSQCSWVDGHKNILIIGPTGSGKTFLACALAHKACTLDHTAKYYRLPRLLSDIALSKNDGRYSKLTQELAKPDVLILDDFGLVAFSDENRRDLLEIIDDRYKKRSTIVTSQLPVKLWHETIGNGTLADAILDRLIHNSYRLDMNMSVDSMRKIKEELIPNQD